MIKGIDAQIMTNRPADYAKDVSAVLRRDDLSNEFANRLNQAESEQNMRSVTEMERMLSKRINPDDENGAQQGAEQEEGQQKNHKKDSPAKLPSVGHSEPRLLDIEV